MNIDLLIIKNLTSKGNYMLSIKKIIAVLNFIFIIVPLFLSTELISPSDYSVTKDRSSDSVKIISAALDTIQWNLQGNAAFKEHQGRQCIYLDGGAALLNDFEM
mgnify:CR=1 FL=1